jgi:hypothetical protein
MQAFQWNALRVGDDVCVHDDDTLDLDLHAGVVMVVQTHPHEANDVGIRLGGDDRAIVYPRRHAVHLGRGGVRPGCWRCQTPSGVAA